VQIFFSTSFYVFVLVKIPSTTFLKAIGSRFLKLFLVWKLIEYMQNYEPSKTKFGDSIAAHIAKRSLKKIS
jgi:hypothetical protein